MWHELAVVCVFFTTWISYPTSSTLCQTLAPTTFPPPFLGNALVLKRTQRSVSESFYFVITDSVSICSTWKNDHIFILLGLISRFFFFYIPHTATLAAVKREACCNTLPATATCPVVFRSFFLTFCSFVLFIVFVNIGVSFALC